MQLEINKHNKKCFYKSGKKTAIIKMVKIVKSAHMKVIKTVANKNIKVVYMKVKTEWIVLSSMYVHKFVDVWKLFLLFSNPAINQKKV